MKLRDDSPNPLNYYSPASRRRHLVAIEKYVEEFNHYSFHDPNVTCHAEITPCGRYIDIHIQFRNFYSTSVDPGTVSPPHEGVVFQDRIMADMSSHPCIPPVEMLRRLWKNAMAHEFEEHLKFDGMWVHDPHSTRRNAPTWAARK